MSTNYNISVELAAKSKLSEIDFNNLPFGKYFTDHMLEADYANGVWTNVSIKPYQAISFEPSMVALHYGQAIFEGIKAYKGDNGDAYIFRPDENFKRFNISAERLCMPAVPEEIFMGGMKQLIAMESKWIPAGKKDYSLYIRPFMFATDTIIGVRPSETYKFFILLCPTGPYYANPMKIKVEETYTRAAPGGVGFSKNAGNYAGSLLAATTAVKNGFDQVLWTDAFEHKWLQEVGTMNVFFIIGNTAVTPSLEDGTILEGVTRKSAITLLTEMGLNVVERKISIDELVEEYKNGNFTEAFGTGTAATVSYIKQLSYGSFDMLFDTDKLKVASELKERFNNIRYGVTADTHNWMVKI